MAKNDNLTDFLTDVADAIREKTGSNELIDPQDFSSEIEGIPTGGEDFTLADATVDDVVAGKTFYAGDSTLKTGTLEYESFLKSIVYFTDSEMTQPDRITVRMPSYCNRLPRYFAWQNLNPVDFYFNSDITRIPVYSFCGTKNFTFPNFTSLTNLTTIESYAFSAANKDAFDLHSWPSSLKVINDRAFLDVIKQGTVLVTPPNLEKLGSYAFASSNIRIEIESISIPSYTNNTLPQSLFYFLDTNCDFTPPSCVTIIGSQFNMRGSFNNVVIPATCTKIENYAFGSNSYESASTFHMDSFTFLSETPPLIGTDIIASQHLTNSSFRIYVPDTAVQAYKAVTNLSRYSAYIVGLSEHPGFTITYNLTNCTSSNTTTTATMGDYYNTTITPDTGYTLDGATVEILMGNSYRQANFYSRSGNDGIIDIASTNSMYKQGIVGDLVINITAMPISE